MFRRLADALGAPGGACGAVRYLSSGPARPSVATLPRRTVLSLEGRDTFKFLQGAITNNVQRLEDERRTGGIVRDVFYAAFLNPQGRMVADALLYHRTQASEPSVLIEVDAQVEGELVKFLKRFKLRSKFRITDVSDAWDVRQVWGPGAEQLIDSAPTDDPHVVAVRDVRAPSMGWRVLSPAGETPSFLASADQVSPEEYTVHRMLSGVPEGADELTSGTSLPLECCVDYMNGVDFHKGCYIGQELTARTHFTGLIRKRVMPVMLTRPDAPAPQPPHADPAHIHALPAHGADVRLTSAQQADNGGKPRRARSAGKFLGGVQNVGLALLRLEQVTQTQNGPSSPQLLIECADGTSAQLHAWRPAWWPANTDDRGE